MCVQLLVCMRALVYGYGNASCCHDASLRHDGPKYDNKSHRNPGFLETRIRELTVRMTAMINRDVMASMYMCACPCCNVVRNTSVKTLCQARRTEGVLEIGVRVQMCVCVYV